MSDGSHPVVEGMRFVRSERSEGMSYDLLESASGPVEIYVDGVAATGFSAAVCRTDFFVLKEAKQEEGEEGETRVEQRVVKLRLIMPTYAMLEMCFKTLNGVRDHERVLTGAIHSMAADVKRYVHSVTPAEARDEEDGEP